LKGKSRRTFDIVESTKCVFIFLISICGEEGKQPGAPLTLGPRLVTCTHTHKQIKSDLIGALQEYKRAKKRILQRDVVTMRIKFVLLKIGSLSINGKCRVFSLWKERIFKHYLD